MAKIKPILNDLELSTLPSQAETKFYTACQSRLPNDWLVLFSVPWIGTGYSGKKYDGEADFVIFAPNYGMLAVEVKGGGVEFDPSIGQWHSTDRKGVRHEIKNPFEQAKGEKHALLGILRKHPLWKERGDNRILACHAVMLSDVDFPDLAGPGSPKEIAGSRNDLQDLEKWVESVFNYWAGRDERWSPLGVQGLQTAEKILSSPLTARPLLSRRLQAEEARRIELTEQQARILRAIGPRNRAIVSGGAGTGKTILALERARQLADSGVRTLLLCYNRLLADHFKVTCLGLENLFPMSFHQLCHWRIKHASTRERDIREEVEMEYPNEDEFDVHLPCGLALSCEILEDKFDAVVVDEGQDFKDTYWLALTYLLSDEAQSPFFIFLDPNQRIYSIEMEDIPIKEEPFLLTFNCRNTKYIHDSAYRFFDGNRVDSPSKNQGTPIRTVEGLALGEQAKLIREEVGKLLSTEAIKEEQIVILIAGRHKEDYYFKLEEMSLPHGFKWNIEGPAESTGVRVDTVKRFKGLEADIVYLWGIESINLPTEGDLLYIAISRAKSRLILVGSKDACSHCLNYGK